MSIACGRQGAEFVELPLFCLPWHTRFTMSIEEMIAGPVRGRISVTLVGWDGQSLPCAPGKGLPFVFWQLPPSASFLAGRPANAVWIPMWDSVRHYSQDQWNALPKWLRIVAFGDAVESRARAAGLKTFSIRYFRDPRGLPPAQWAGPRVLMYWNRTGVVGPAFLRRLCQVLQVEKLVFRDLPDPGYERPYALPSRLNHTRVVTVRGFESHDEYLRLWQEANLFIAPRKSEGVGLTMIEALARGCAVFGYNAPSMNEYIRHGETGYLLPSVYRTWLNIARSRARRVLTRIHLVPNRKMSHTVSEYQDWSEIATLNLEGLGRAARMDQEAGYRQWRQRLPGYVQFILEGSVV